jgi:hypothetical protein
MNSSTHTHKLSLSHTHTQTLTHTTHAHAGDVAIPVHVSENAAFLYEDKVLITIILLMIKIFCSDNFLSAHQSSELSANAAAGQQNNENKYYQN